MASQSQLVMRTGPTPGKTFTLTKSELFVGRDISNDIVINDAEVSRKHVRLILQAGQYVLEDLGSTNGTFINGQRISGPHILMPDQSIQMGENVVLVYEQVSYDPDATAVMSTQEIEEEDAPQVQPEPAAPPPSPSPEPEPPAPEPMAPEPVATGPSATMAEFQEISQEPAPPQPQMPPPVQPSQPEPSETYTGPGMPVAEQPMEEEKPKSNRNTILAGCGCLVVLACVVVIAAGFYIDANNLYCELPILSQLFC